MVNDSHDNFNFQLAPSSSQQLQIIFVSLKVKQGQTKLLIYSDQRFVTGKKTGILNSVGKVGIS